MREKEEIIREGTRTHGVRKNGTPSRGRKKMGGTMGHV